VIIGIDARKLWDGGIGTYIRGLLQGIAAVPRAPSLVALVDPGDAGTVAWGGAVREIPVRAGKYGLREHWEVPGAARAAGVTLLHEPHYTLPLLWTGRSVVTIHDLIHVRFARFFRPGVPTYARAMAGLAARRAGLVIANSEHTRADVIELLRVPAEKVHAIPLGVSPGLRVPAHERVAAFRSARGLPLEYVLYVGARKPHKNLPLMLQAMGQIEPSRRPPLVLSGDRWASDSALAGLAARLGLEPFFAGDLRDDESLSCLYAGAALYVHPALTEGFGLPPLEAMSCGVPVLSSNGGALPETVGDAAAVLPPSDPERWGAEIEALLGDSARRDDLVRRGRARAASFTWERAAARTIEVYERVMRE
jgi:glycosyltransferase involved in cell wall biosynthesis